MDYRKLYFENFGQQPDHFEIHHMDHNRNNNEISNLVSIPRKLHKRYHAFYNFISQHENPLQMIRNITIFKDYLDKFENAYSEIIFYCNTRGYTQKEREELLERF